jgi:nucleoside-diphosphate-sugar epimerase
VAADASDRTAVANALRGSDALVHLAGIPSPRDHDALTVFTNNTSATFNVLDEAAEQGILAAVVASSVSALGLVYAEEPFSPIYAPVDESHPLYPKDAYALAKQCDEAIAAMTSRRSGMRTLAYRFPYTTTWDAIADRARAMSTRPEDGSRELWAYLDVRDAAEACWLGVRALLADKIDGPEVLNIMADDSILTTPPVDLIRTFHPHTTRLPSLNHSRCAYTTDRAKELIGFTAAHLLHVPGG